MRNVWMVISVLALSSLALIVGLWTGTVYHRQIASTLTGEASAPPADELRPVKVNGPQQLYMCAMDHHIQNHGGPCEICGMPVEPLKADSLVGGTGVTVDPVIVQNMGMRVAKVSRGTLQTTLRMVGSLVEPEQNHVEINLRVSGWIQKLYANQDGIEVNKGDKLFDLYSLELTSAADELINARKATDAMTAQSDPVTRSTSAAMLAAAKRKLELMGIGADEVDSMAKLDKAPAVVTFTSPMSGHVVERTVIEGSSVKAGDRLMRIADRSTMWMQIQIYEQQLPLIKVGMPVQAQFSGMPGKTYDGNIDFMYPHLDMTTRTAMARVTLKNPGHDLHEGMYATATINSPISTGALLVPREAVIDSGTRQIVFISLGQGHFEPRTVTVGDSGHAGDAASGNDTVQIISGLSENDTVVTSGQFLLDSESRMQEAIQKHIRERLMEPGSASPSMAIASATMPTTHPAIAKPDRLSDQVFTAYVNLEKSFVGSGKPVDSTALAQAAGELMNAQSHGTVHQLAMEIGNEASQLNALPIDKQREEFKALSAAVMSLVDLVPPSTAVAPVIFQFHCPMANADWLATSEEVANPYQQDMTTCGSVTKKITTIPAEKNL